MSSGVDNRGDPFFIRFSCCCGDGPFLLLPFDVFFVADEMVLLEGGAGVLGEEGDEMVVVVVVVVMPLLLLLPVVIEVVIALVECAVAWVATVAGIDGVVDVAGEVDPSSSGGSSSVVSSCLSDADAALFL